MTAEALAKAAAPIRQTPMLMRLIADAYLERKCNMMIITFLYMKALFKLLLLQESPPTTIRKSAINEVT